jgi:hypothetical protein
LLHAPLSLHSHGVNSSQAVPQPLRPSRTRTCSYETHICVRTDQMERDSRECTPMALKTPQTMKYVSTHGAEDAVTPETFSSRRLEGCSLERYYGNREATLAQIMPPRLRSRPRWCQDGTPRARFTCLASFSTNDSPIFLQRYQTLFSNYTESIHSLLIPPSCTVTYSLLPLVYCSTNTVTSWAY